jgi:hypothetical protein
VSKKFTIELNKYQFDNLHCLLQAITDRPTLINSANAFDVQPLATLSNGDWTYEILDRCDFIVQSDMSYKSEPNESPKVLQQRVLDSCNRLVYLDYYVKKYPAVKLALQSLITTLRLVEENKANLSNALSMLERYNK